MKCEYMKGAFYDYLAQVTYDYIEKIIIAADFHGKDREKAVLSCAGTLIEFVSAYDLQMAEWREKIVNTD
mgnify:CR=1 FL=1